MAKLTLGPVLYNWAPEIWRDFYFRIADEAPLDTVYVGEVVCSKRAPYFEPHMPEVIERLDRAGKKVVLSTLALIMTAREARMVRDIAGCDSRLIEANDISALTGRPQRPFVAGPFLNIYNEGTLTRLAQWGASRAVLPAELPSRSIEILANTGVTEIEVQVFGRLPLAVSARCYHARAHGLAKDNCQYVCADDPGGMRVDSLDGEPFLNVNGIQTLSHACCNLIGELSHMREMGVSHFRLWPQEADTVAVAEVFRAVLDGEMEPVEANRRLAGLCGDIPFANGFFHGLEGVRHAPAAAKD